jgi:NADPH:quinone reductase-like Zn-dependent oxidoreductase
MSKRGAVIATSLRARPTEEKAAICASVVEHVWPLIGEGGLRTVVHEEVPLAEVSRAHELLASGTHSGKILLIVGG